MNQSQVNKIQCLNYVYAYIAYECSRVYMCVSQANYDKIIKITRLRQVRIILPFSKLSNKTKQTRWETSTKYIHKSHMSAVVYTLTFHRPTHSNLEVLQSSYRFTHNAKPIHFQNKIKLDPTKHRLSTLKPLN